MSKEIHGIHPIMALAGDPRININFYDGMPGLRFVELFSFVAATTPDPTGTGPFSLQELQAFGNFANRGRRSGAGLV